MQYGASDTPSYVGNYEQQSTAIQGTYVVTPSTQPLGMLQKHTGFVVIMDGERAGGSYCPDGNPGPHQWIGQTINTGEVNQMIQPPTRLRSVIGSNGVATIEGLKLFTRVRLPYLSTTIHPDRALYSYLLDEGYPVWIYWEPRIGKWILARRGAPDDYDPILCSTAFTILLRFCDLRRRQDPLETNGRSQRYPTWLYPAEQGVLDVSYETPPVTWFKGPISSRTTHDSRCYANLPVDAMLFADDQLNEDALQNLDRENQ